MNKKIWGILGSWVSGVLSVISGGTGSATGNVSGLDFSTPPAIGGTTPAAGAFTTVKMTTGAAVGLVVSDVSGNLVADSTPALGTPSSGTLNNCTVATASDNDSDTSLASTAFAKSQDAVLAREPDQGVAMTYAASGSSGITVADNDNIDFGTGNFALVINDIADWLDTLSQSPFAYFKYSAAVGFGMRYISGKLRLELYRDSTQANHETAAILSALPVGSAHQIVAVVIRETALVDGSVTFYIDGVQVGSPIVIDHTHAKAGYTLSNANPLYIQGTSAGRSPGTAHHAYTFNRALTAAEVLDLYRNGIAESDKWGSQTSLVTGTDSDFSGAGNWTSDAGTFDVNSTVAGKAYMLGDGTGDTMSLANKVVENLRYRITLKARLNTGVSTEIFAGRYPQVITSWPWSFAFTPTATEATYSGEITIAAGFSGSLSIGRNAAAGGMNGIAIEIDDVVLTKLGATLALTPEGIQPAPGQWLDSSSNKLHGLQPATGSSLTRYKKTGEIRWTNTWAGTHELQYIGGVNQAILPANCYIESIIGVVSGSTVEDIIVGDGSDTDHWVEITTGLAAGTYSFAIANKISDGTNYKMTVDPDANFTGSIIWTIKYSILEA